MLTHRSKSPYSLHILAGALGLSIAATHGLVAEASPPDPEPVDCSGSLTPPSGDQCLAITIDELTVLHDLLDEALLHAEADAATHGVTGAYASAAENQRMLLERGRDAVEDRIVWLQTPAQAPADVTTYAEAGTIGIGLMPVIDDLVNAGHWGAISAIYHDSQEARTAFERGAEAIELTNELRTRAYRCYVDAYLD